MAAIIPSRIAATLPARLRHNEWWQGNEQSTYRNLLRSLYARNTG